MRYDTRLLLVQQDTRQPELPDVRRQLAVERREIRPKDFEKRLVRRRAARHLGDELPELRPPRAVVADEQVVGERPRLRVHAVGPVRIAEQPRRVGG
jgi:hypothetical protein